MKKSPSFVTQIASKAASEGDRESLIDALCDRFYMNEQATLVSNGLSTEFLYFPSDLNTDPASRKYLQDKIHNVINYTTAFFDIEEINALLKLSPKEPKFYSVLGLYLYAADTFSRECKNTTFLTELRNAGIIAKDGEPFDREATYEKVKHMLKTHGLTESLGGVFESWYQNGHYTSALRDLDEIRAVLRLPPREPKFDDALGVYLYFADECRRLHPETTFVAELRKAGIKVKKNDPNYNRQDLCAQISRVLDSLGMPDSDKQILSNWYETGNFTHALRNVAEINALLRLPPKEPDVYRALALYTYFSDECKRLHPETTFIDELRKADIKVLEGQPYEQRDVYQKIMHVLDTLGMSDEHKEILKNWYEKGEYTLSDGYEGDALPGAYTRLARDICSTRTYLPLNLAISYALGNKEFIQSKSAEETYQFTDSLTGPSVVKSINPEITKRISMGDALREQRIRDILDKKREEEREKKSDEKSEEEPEGKLHPQIDGRKDLAKAIFSKLPNAALEIFYREGYNCAYADDKNISKCYPEKLLPGELQKDHDRALTSLGLRDRRYRILYMSNGLDENMEHKDIKLTQTIMHEMMHMAISYLSKDQKEVLWQKAQTAYEELKEFQSWREDMDADASREWLEKHPMPPYFSDKLKTMSAYKLANGKQLTPSLEKVLDYKAFPYSGYSNQSRENLCEEMVCNVAGFMYSEFPYSSKRGVHPNPYADLKALGLPALEALAKQINESLEIACSKSREEFPYIEMPSASAQASVGGRV